MTFSITSASTFFNWNIIVLNYTNYKTVNPIQGTGSYADVTGTTPLSYNLNSTPDLTSEVVACSVADGSGGTNIIVGTGWTSLFVDVNTLGDGVTWAAQVKPSPSSAAVLWNKLQTDAPGGGVASAAVEVISAAAVVQLGTLSPAIGGAWGVGAHGHMSDNPIPVNPPYGAANLITVAADDTALVIGIAFMSSTHGDDDPGTVTFTWDNGGTNQAMTQLGPPIKSSLIGGNATSVVYFFGLESPTSGTKSFQFSWTDTTHLQEMYVTAATFKKTKTNGTAFYGYGTDRDHDEPAGTILDQVNAGALIPSSDMAISFHANSMVNINAPIAWTDPAANATGIIIDLDGHVTNQAYAQYFRGNNGILNARADNAEAAWWCAAIVAVRSASSGPTTWLASAALTPSSAIAVNATKSSVITTWQGTAVLAASSTLSAIPRATFQAKATLAGSSIIACSAAATWQATAVLAGSSSLACNAVKPAITWQGTAVLAASSSLITNPLRSPTFLQRVSESNANNPHVISFPAPIKAGSFIIVAGDFGFDGSATLSSIIDDKGDAVSQVLAPTSSTSSLFYCSAFYNPTAGAQTITVTLAGTVTWNNVIIWEVAGMPNPIKDKAILGSGTGLTADTGSSGTLSATPEVAISWGDESNAFVAGDPNWAHVLLPGGGPVGQERILLSTAAINALATTTGAGDSWGLGLATFQGSSVATWQATALLAATSTLSVNVIENSLAAAVLPGASSLTANALAYLVARATLPATSTLAVNTKLYSVASALLPAASLISVDAKIYSPVFATLPATSTLIANTPSAGSSAVLPATSLLSASALQTYAVLSTLPAASLISVDVRVYRPALATLPATSTLAANAIIYKPLSAILPCASTLSVDAKIYSPVFATLPATSVLSATATVIGLSTATLPMTSDLSATARIALVGRAILNATSSLSTITTQNFAAFATLGASSNLSALVSIRWPSLATLPLSSSIFADTQIKGTVNANATLAGSSTLSCSTSQLFGVRSVLPLTSLLSADSILRGQIFAAATIPASSSLAATAVFLLRSAATLPLTSSFSADSIIRGQIFASSTLPATSSLVALARQQWSSASTLPSTSSLLVNSVQRWAARAQCDSVSTLQAIANVRLPILAKLIGSSAIIVDALDISASAIFPRLALSSTLRADMALVRLVRHWQRHITTTGVVTLPKRLRGAITRPNLNGEVS
jgi:hypothetical protein